MRPAPEGRARAIGRAVRRLRQRRPARSAHVVCRRSARSSATVGTRWRDVSAPPSPRPAVAAPSRRSSPRGAGAGRPRRGRRHRSRDRRAGGRVALWRNGGDDRAAPIAARRARGPRQQPPRRRREGPAARRQPERDGSRRRRRHRRWRPPISCSAWARDRGADVVRVLWPSGILQAETPARAGGAAPATLPSPFVVEELDRKPSSCPFLFTWNGERFEFVTDFHGRRRDGLLGGARACATSRIRSSTCASAATSCSRRTAGSSCASPTSSKRRCSSIACSSWRSRTRRMSRSIRTKGMTDPPKPFRLFAVPASGVRRARVDDHGHDVTDRIARIDRRYPDDFALEPFRGYAAPHALTLDLGAGRPSAGAAADRLDRLRVLERQRRRPPGGPVAARRRRSRSRTRRARWRTAIADIGIPVGRPQTIAVDLGRASCARASTKSASSPTCGSTGTSAGRRPRGRRRSPARPSRSIRDGGDLRARGFSAEVRPDGSEPPAYDYDRVTLAVAVEGDAGPLHARRAMCGALLTRADDHVRDRQARRRDRARLRRGGAAAAARRLDAHVSAACRRLQQGDGHQLREPGHASSRCRSTG